MFKFNFNRSIDQDMIWMQIDVRSSFQLLTMTWPKLVTSFTNEIG